MLNSIKRLGMALVVVVIATSNAGLVSAATLGIGSRGAEVTRLQTWLIDNGYPIPLIENGAPKGYFGEQTRDAVNMYFEDSGRELTGTIDTSDIFSQRSTIVGAVATNEIVQNNFAFGGKRLWAYSQRIPSTLASTSCSILAPTATSTVLSAAYGVTSISSTSLMAIGWSSGPMATTTTLMPTSAQMLNTNPQPVHASSTAGTFVVPPATKDAVSGNLGGSYINFKIAGGATQTAAPVGTCSVIFVED